MSEHDKALLRARFATREDAVTAVKWNSSVQHKRCLQDNNKSGPRYVTYRCARNDVIGDARFQCQYHCTLKCKPTEGYWYVQKSGMKGFKPHSTGCLSRAQLTTKEALFCSPVVNTVTSNVSIADSVQRVARDARLPQVSVSNWVANRKRKEQNGTVEEMYEINWGKLDTWGKEFVRKNPGSHYDIETKGGRFERMFVGCGPAAAMALKTGLNFSLNKLCRGQPDLLCSTLGCLELVYA